MIVISGNFFNQSGKAIVCPIMKKAVPGPLRDMFCAGKSAIWIDQPPPGVMLR